MCPLAGSRGASDRTPGPQPCPTLISNHHPPNIMTVFPWLSPHQSRPFLAALVAIALAVFTLGGCQAVDPAPTQRNEVAPAEVTVDAELEAQILAVIRNNPQVILDAVQDYQQAQQEAQQQAALDFQQTLTRDPQAIIGDAPVTGAADYNVVMIEFSDFQCPFCARAHTTVQAFMAANADTVTLAYKHLPLADIHDQAIAAAEAAWAAQQQGKFWDYHDRLFANQARLGEALYQEIAQDLGLDLETFTADRARAAATIQDDLALAQQLGLSSTPTFLLVSTETGKIELLSGALSLEELETQLEFITTP